MIYLDNAATTKPKQEVCRAIADALENEWYNPSSLYCPAIDVRKAVDKARKTVALSVGASPDEICFTSSGSESNNLAIQGFHKAHPNGYIITTCIEHKSIIECVKQFSGNVFYIPVDERCEIDILYLDNLLCQLNSEIPMFVSIQYANNETGTIQNMNLISKIVHKYNAILHTDAVQAYAHHHINVKKLGIDMMSVSGHKFGCPKGIGFLYIKDNVCIRPLIYGSQENGIRGGTENVPYIIGLAKAVDLKNIKQTEEIREYFETRLKEIGCRINCENAEMRIESIISCTLPEGIIGELFIYMLAFDKIYVSAGSACNSHSNKPSYVLSAIGLTEDEIQRTIRISFDDELTNNNIDMVIDMMQKCIHKIIN